MYTQKVFIYGIVKSTRGGGVFDEFKKIAALGACVAHDIDKENGP